MLMKNTLLIVLLALFSASGCSTNPVTGERELVLIPGAQELDIGKQNYAPLRQSQGADYVVDPGIEAYVNQVGQRLAALLVSPSLYISTPRHRNPAKGLIRNDIQQDRSGFGNVTHARQRYRLRYYQRMEGT